MVKCASPRPWIVEGERSGDGRQPGQAKAGPRQHRNRAASVVGHIARHDSGSNVKEGFCVMSTMQESRVGSDFQSRIGSAVLHRVADAIATAFAAVVKEIRARRAMHELASMGEDMLRDIGLTRDDVEHVVRYGRY